MSLQGVEFQGALFLIVCRNAVPDPDLEMGGGGGAPLGLPLEMFGFLSRIGYYIHCNLSSGMKIRVSIYFFSIPTTGGKIVETLSFKMIPWFSTAHLLLRITRWPP